MLCIAALCALFLLFFALTDQTGGITQPPTVTYGEMMSRVKRTYDGDINQVISAMKYDVWVAHRGRVWACGYQRGFSSLEEIETWVASADPHGLDITQNQLIFAPNPELQAARQALLAQNPNLAFQMGNTLQGVFFDSGDNMLVLLCESLQGQDSVTGEYTNVTRFSLCPVDAGGAAGTPVPIQWPAQVNADAQFFGITDAVWAGDSALWLRLNVPEENGAVSAGVFVRINPADGSCTAVVSLPQAYCPGTDCKDMLLQPDGSILVLGKGPDPTQEPATSVDGFVFPPAQVPVLFAITDTTGPAPAVSGPVQLDLADARGFVFPLDGPPTGDVYLHTNDGLYLCDAAAGTTQQLQDWDFYAIQPENDPTQVMFYNQNGISMQFLRIGGETGMTMLETVAPEELAKLPTISVAYTAENMPIDRRLKKYIYDYNVAGNDHYIKVVDYGMDAAQAAGFATGQEMLLQHLAAGTAPDILLLSSWGNTAEQVQQGWFMDLYPFIDDDPDMSRQDFLPGVLAATELDGIQPALTLDYAVHAFVGSAQVLGADPGWTWQQYDDLLARYPQAQLVNNWPRDSLLLSMLRAGGDDFIDHSSGTANLDSPGFIRLLAASAAWPQESALYNTDPRLALADRQVLTQYTVIEKFRDILSLEYTFGEPVAFKGLPDASGAVFQPHTQLSISASCRDLAAAWHFARGLLLPQFQDTLLSSFPVRIDSLQNAAHLARQPDVPERVGNISYWHYGYPVYLGYDSGVDLHGTFSRALSADQTDRVMALLQTLDTAICVESDISQIVLGELPAFYDGTRTAAETAALLQQKVQAYFDRDTAA